MSHLQIPPTRLMSTELANWYIDTLEQFRLKFSLFAKEALGCRFLSEDRGTRSKWDNASPVVSTNALSIATGYLVLPRDDGSVLIEVSSHEEFINIMVFTIDYRRLARIIKER